MIRIASFVALGAVVAALSAVAPQRAPGCASAPPRGERVEIASEAALIIWDEANKTEHFIRRANFRSTASEFGFLVPTPTQPDLGEADDSLFDYLAGITAPKHEDRHVKRPRPRQRHGATDSNAMGERSPRSGVEVLEEKQVAGMDAVVLKFHRGAKGDDPTADAKELADWLQKRGFEFGPAIAAWLKPYIANDWVMTAFKIAGGKAAAPGSSRPPAPGAPQAKGVRGAPVRMSFKTDRPFYPYREPVADKQQPLGYEDRLLRVYFIADKRYAGTLGEGTKNWPGGTVWSDKLTENQVWNLPGIGGVNGKARLPGALKLDSHWLTEFEDHSTPRPATDEVYFKPAAVQDAVARPPIIHEIVEWYDEPEPETETPYAVKLIAVLGGIAVLGVLLFVFLRQRGAP